MSSGSPRLRLKTIVFSLIVILSNALGNTALAWGMRHGHPDLQSPLAYIQVIFNPWVMLGITLLIVWLFSRMALLSWADLSFVLPVTSAGYVLSALFGHIFFDEQISVQRFVGTLLIVAGTIVVGIAASRTSESTAAPSAPPENA